MQPLIYYSSGKHFFGVKYVTVLASIHVLSCRRHFFSTPNRSTVLGPVFSLYRPRHICFLSYGKTVRWQVSIQRTLQKRKFVICTVFFNRKPFFNKSTQVHLMLSLIFFLHIVITNTKFAIFVHCYRFIYLICENHQCISAVSIFDITFVALIRFSDLFRFVMLHYPVS